MDSPRAFHRHAERRLRRWHRRIVADWKAFDDLDEPALHSLRKRIKRQRYALEFFKPILRRSQVTRYLQPLAAVQERMGQLVDLFVARQSYEELGNSSPSAWFAMGWIAARVAEVRALVKKDLGQLAETSPPAH